MSAVPRKRAKTSSVYECRACLMKIHDDSCCVDIFCAWDSSWPGMGASIAQDLIKLSNVQISATDPHSKNICKSCCSRLREALLFTSIVQKNDLFIRKRLRESSSESPMWPKPIQVDKNFTANTLNAMTAEVKEEVLTDDEQEINETCSELIEPKLDIKIEPEEMTPAAIPSIEIEINCPLLHPGRDDQEVKTNGATEILDEVNTRQEGMVSTSRAAEIPVEIPKTGVIDIESIGNDIEVENVQKKTHSCTKLPAANVMTKQENTKMKEISDSIQTILKNQHNMAKVMSVMVNNQKKIIHNLASLYVQPNELTSTNQNVTPLNRTTYAEPIEIKPIESIDALDELESLLSDNTSKSTLLRQYKCVCPESNGKGVTCAYKLLDMLFARDFLCNCSWTGGSRNSDQIKIGLKGYKNILNFFYELIYYWDKTFTLQDNERFFKVVLKNSLKRKLSKNVRTSTKRTRINKNAHGRKNDIENGTEQINEKGSGDRNLADKIDTKKTESAVVIDQTGVEEKEEDGFS